MNASTFVRAALLALVILPAAGRAQDSGVVGQLEQSAQTTPEEKIRFADMALEQMRISVREVARMLEAAEQEKEMNRIQCLSKKLTTMRALLEVSEASAGYMKQALAAGENETADHEYRKVAVALGKIRQFRAEADACVGRSVGDGNVQIEVLDAGVSYGDDETSGYFFDDTTYGDQPPSTSQYQ